MKPNLRIAPHCGSRPMTASPPTFTAYMNGEKVGAGAGWNAPRTIDVTKFIRQGDNVLAIEAENLPAQTANPAGLIAELGIQTHIGEEYDVRSDATWRSAKDIDPKSTKWTTIDFDDMDWPAAQEVAKYGSGPWGEFPTPTSYGPYATGIPGKVRIIYVPEPRSIRVHHLEPNVKYRAAVFAPQSGETVELGSVTPDDNSSWIVWKSETYIDGDRRVKFEAPDDWVLILEATQ
jgi:hypothetical protein